MSFAVIHMQKLKATDIKGIQFHNQRERESQTNKDIDKSKEHLNYDLLNESKMDYNDRIKKEIEDRYTGTKKIRKDAVRLCSFMVTSDKEFFDRLDPAEEKRFFEESLTFLQTRYGKQNMIYSVVHKDEKTPHMHVGMVPITSDGKLTAKEFFGKRTELQQMQDTFHEHVTKKGFALERGVSSNRKHVEIHRFKAITAKEEVKKLESELDEKQDQKIALESSIKDLKGRLNVLEGDLRDVKNHVQRIDQIETKKPKMNRESVLIKHEDFVSLQNTAKKVPILVRESVQLKNENKQLTQRVSGLESDTRTLRKENKELKTENSKLKNLLGKVQTFFKEHEMMAKFNEFIKSFSKDKEQQKRTDLER
jgi:hypothetical protein